MNMNVLTVLGVFFGKHAPKKSNGITILRKFIVLMGLFGGRVECFVVSQLNCTRITYVLFYFRMCGSVNRRTATESAGVYFSNLPNFLVHTPINVRQKTLHCR